MLDHPFLRRLLSPGWAAVTVTGIAVAALAIALYFQHVLGHEPCSMCVQQRALYLLTAFAGLFLLALPQLDGPLADGILLVPPLGGLVVAVGHWSLQAFPPAVSNCVMSDPNAWMEGLPFEAAWRWMFASAGDCTIPTYVLPGVSMVHLSVANFAFLAAVAAGRLLLRQRKLRLLAA